ncbi:MAG: hypothetical protein V5786_01230 [Psychromonas sp.]
MALQTLKELEDAIGGRPALTNRKQRLSFYLNDKEALILKAYALENNISVSRVISDLLRPLLSKT